jgi:hypothetical protein
MKKIFVGLMAMLSSTYALADNPYQAESGDRLIVVSVNGRAELGGWGNRSNEAYEMAVSSAILQAKKKCKKVNGELVGDFVVNKTYNGSGSNTQTLVLSQVCLLGSL